MEEPPLIAVGSDAGIVIFDPNKIQTFSVSTHHMNADYSAYEGRKVHGAVETVLSRGLVVIENGGVQGEAGVWGVPQARDVRVYVRKELRA